ncbi:transglutaminase-like domain-containing protein [Mariniblastus sp.]|nr:transglutaminase-like domain-containing protein [Mariniblastus sp.]
MKFAFSDRYGVCLVVIALLTSVGCDGGEKEVSDTDKPSTQALGEVPVAESRQFEFDYAADIQGLPEKAMVRVWFPVAESNPQQTVEMLSSDVPGELTLHRDQKYQNQIGYLEQQMDKSGAGTIHFGVKYKISRGEATTDDSELSLSQKQKNLFLSANTMVPIEGKPQSLLAEKQLPKDPVEAGFLLYDTVESHMTYDKSKPGYGKGDAVWACNSQTGNCTDFHSLFISLARSQQMPAKFEIGFPIPTDKQEGKVGGYHCWAWFHADGIGWTPVDISEADKNPAMRDYYFGKLSADRVTFSTGRDIELVPETDHVPLNYFVYPYVEVNGESWPREKIKLNFSFKNSQ